MRSASVSYHEYLVVGAGPAGLQMGYYLERHLRDYLILESDDSPGAFFKRFPRHRKLISINKVHTGCTNRDTNLRWDWNSLLSDSEDMLFTRYSRQYFPHADDFVRYLKDFAEHFHLKVKYGTRVVNIQKSSVFMVIDNAGNVYNCKRLIIATGRPVPYIPPILGVEFAENYATVSIDPEEFTNQRVMIIGKGNSGFETGDNLVETAAVLHMTSPTPVRLAWKTHYVGHLRAVNNNILDTYQLKSQNTIVDAIIERIQPRDEKFEVDICYTHAQGQGLTIPVDRIITCTGFHFDDSIFDDSCHPVLALGNKYPAQTSEWESVNVKELYFAGTLMHMRDYQKTFSGFIHGFRYNIQVLDRIFSSKYHGEAWPSQSIPTTPNALLDLIIERANTCSSLFQQPAFLCDLLVISRQDREVQYYQDLPLDYVHDTKLGQHEHYYTLTMEYGHEDYCDPFNIQRSPHEGTMSAFIHPVIRRFIGANFICEYHIPEDLENNWKQEMYTQPFLAFLRRELRDF